MCLRPSIEAIDSVGYDAKSWPIKPTPVNKATMLKRVGEFLLALFGELVYEITYMNSYVDNGSSLTTADVSHFLF